MPSKRSRSEERERKRKFRAKMSVDAKKIEREKARKGMAEIREKLRFGKDEHNNLTKGDKTNDEDGKLYHETERFARESYQRKLGMRKKRENLTVEELNVEREKAREGMRRMREAQTEDTKTAEREKDRLRKRKQRILQMKTEKTVATEITNETKHALQVEIKGQKDIVEILNQKYRNDKETKKGNDRNEKVTVRNLKKDDLKKYKNKKYQERRSNYKELTRFENIKRKYKYREEKLKTELDKDEVLTKKNKNESDLFQDLYQFYKTTDEARNITVREYPELCPKFEDLRNTEEEEKKKYESVAKKVKTVVEDCVCDFDLNCKFCEGQHDDEKNFYADALNVFTELEEQQFVKEELQAIRNLKKKERKEKRTEKTREAKKPLPPLPFRELSLYEKIRKDIITEREREWVIYEKEWEKKDKAEAANKNK